MSLQMSRVLDFGTNCDSTLEAGTKLGAEDNERKEDSNSYLRNSRMKNNAEKKPCKCGAVSHTHKDCPSKRSPLRQEKLINNVTTEDIFVISPPPTDEWMSQAAAVIQTFSGCRRVSLRKDRICRVNCPEISPVPYKAMEIVSLEHFLEQLLEQKAIILAYVWLFVNT